MSLTGRIGKPMITLHGDLDALLPIRTDSDVYNQMIDEAGRGNLHRYYTIQDGNHVDGRADLYPDQLRPILPCYREAFLRLTAWVTAGQGAAGDPDGGPSGHRRPGQHLPAAGRRDVRRRARAREGQLDPDGSALLPPGAAVTGDQRRRLGRSPGRGLVQRDRLVVAAQYCSTGSTIRQERPTSSARMNSVGSPISASRMTRS